jgi:hypothetical protein
MIYSSLSSSSSSSSSSSFSLLAPRTDGLHKLLSLEHLDLSMNVISSLEEVKRLAALPILTALFLRQNPLAKMSNYRKAVLCLFERRDIYDDPLILDGQQPTEEERQLGMATQSRRPMVASSSLAASQGSTTAAHRRAHARRSDHHGTSVLRSTNSTLPGGAAASINSAQSHNVEEVVVHRRAGPKVACPSSSVCIRWSG